MANFTITASPTSLTNNGTATLTLQSDSAFKDSVDLSGSANVSCSILFDPTSVFLCHDDTQEATVSVTNLADPGILTVVASGGGVVHTISITLV